MKWSEQPADIAPAPLTDALRAFSATDAVLLARRLRDAPMVFLSPECRLGILAHLRSHPTELGGLLLGRPYAGGARVPVTWRPLVAIDRFVPSERFRSSSVSLAMDVEIWDRAGVMMARDGSMIVGWYHSHPNLGAFFSGTDRATQRAFFNTAYSVGLVVDPLRGEEAWFIGGRSASLKTQSILDASFAVPSATELIASTEKAQS